MYYDVNLESLLFCRLPVGTRICPLCMRVLIHEVYIHDKLEKFKRGRSLSLHLAKEGDFVGNNSET